MAKVQSTTLAERYRRLAEYRAHYGGSASVTEAKRLESLAAVVEAKIAELSANGHAVAPVRDEMFT